MHTWQPVRAAAPRAVALGGTALAATLLPGVPVVCEVGVCSMHRATSGMQTPKSAGGLQLVQPKTKDWHAATWPGRF